MEALYSKLYNKYIKLKKEKESQFDELNHDQEVKFLNYANASDEMIQFLKTENEKLDGLVEELKSELALIRSSSAEQHTDYQKLLMEENQKNKELSEKIERLQNLQHNQCPHCNMTGEIRHGEEKSQDDAPSEKMSGGSVTELTKKRKHTVTSEGTTNTSVDMEGPSNIQQPVCCQKKILTSGGDGDDTDTSSVNCVFQYLVEFVVDMKVSPLAQSKELCVLVHHQSSGYSFSLTWIHNSRGEVEILYRMSSLGTLERIAPEWMKETLVFSTSMCGIFFERVSRVIRS